MFSTLKAVGIFVIFSVLAIEANRSVQAATIASWTFETSLPATAGPFNPEVGAGSATALHASASAVYSNPAGNGSAHSYSSNFWGSGDYYQFKVDTTGYEDIQLSWDQTGSATGPRDFVLQYSTDGSAFTDFGSTYSVLLNGGAPNASWNSVTSVPAYTFSQDLSSIAGIENQSTVYFRLKANSGTAINGGSIATGGTDRVDNFSVVATAVPEPTTIGFISLAITGLGIASLRKRKFV